MEDAKAAFKELGEYKDSSDLLVQCETLADSERKGRKRKVTIGVAVLAAVVLAAVTFTILIPSLRVNAAMKKAEGGNYAEAVGELEELVNQKVSGAEDALDEVKYSYVTANLNSSDETTCRYLLDLKGKGYKDSQRQFDELYRIKVVPGGTTRQDADMVAFDYTIEGCMPGHLDD